MSFYECVFIMRQDIPTQDVHKAADDFGQLAKGFGGKLVKKEYWGLRNLSHIIKKNKRGHYVMLCLEGSFEAIVELERNFKLSDNVLRFLTLSVDAIPEAPSAMMSAPADVESVM